MRQTSRSTDSLPLNHRFIRAEGPASTEFEPAFSIEAVHPSRTSTLGVAVVEVVVRMIVALMVVVIVVVVGKGGPH